MAQVKKYKLSANEIHALMWFDYEGSVYPADAHPDSEVGERLALLKKRKWVNVKSRGKGRIKITLNAAGEKALAEAEKAVREVGGLHRVYRSERFNPSPRHKKYIGHIGDMDPIEHWGGIIYDAGYGPHLTYFQSWFNESANRHQVTVYDFPIEDDVVKDLDWVNWDDVANSIGMDVEKLKGYGRSDNIFARASTYEAVAGYYGFHELDSDPQEMTMGRANQKYGRAVAAALRAEQKARTGNPGSAGLSVPWVAKHDQWMPSPEGVPRGSRFYGGGYWTVMRQGGLTSGGFKTRALATAWKASPEFKRRYGSKRSKKRKNPKGTKRVTNVRSLVAKALK